MSSIRIWVKENNRWEEIANGPFPITRGKLERCRQLFAEELALAKPLMGAKIAPQTAARDILNKECPELYDFDLIMLGFAVTNKEIKVQEV